MIVLFLALLSMPAAPTEFWSVDLQADDGGFLSYGETGQWEWGDVTSGPMSGWAGQRAWGTELGGFYLNDAVDHLELSLPHLEGRSRPVLEFMTWYDIEQNDSGTIEVHGPLGWEEVAPVYGYPTDAGFVGAGMSWRAVHVDLTQHLDADALRLAFSSDERFARTGWYVDGFALYDGDPIPPKVRFVQCLSDTDDLEGPYRVEAVVEDDTMVAAVNLLWNTTHVAEVETSMDPLGGDTWVGYLPAQGHDTTVQYLVSASDGENTSTGPRTPCSFRVRLPAPEALDGPGERVWGYTAPLSWEPPDTTHQVLGYSLYRDDELIMDVTGLEVEAPLVTGTPSFSVSALFEAGEGDRSDPVLVTAAVPSLAPLEPDSGHPSERLRLRLSGEYLLLDSSDVQVDLGSQITVREVEVRSVDTAYITIGISGDAEPGPRNLLVTTGGLEVSAPGAFTVLDGEDRPYLAHLEPSWLLQGAEETITITASDAFHQLPNVTIGELVIQTVDLVEPHVVEVQLAVPWNTPVGDHTVEVDDGIRLFTGLKLTVRDIPRQVDPPCGCGSSGVPMAAPLVLPALLLRRRRRR